MPVEEHPKNPDLDDAEDPEVEGFSLLDGVGLATPHQAWSHDKVPNVARRSTTFEPKFNRAAQLIDKHNA